MENGGKQLTWLLLAICVLGTTASVAKPGDRFKISIADLPAPNTTAPNDIDPWNSGPHQSALPQVSPGFAITAFASGPQLQGARWLAVAANGDVFVAQSGIGKIVVLRDADGDGKAEIVSTFAAGLVKPHGMVFAADTIYIADVRAIWRFPYHDGDLVANGAPTRVTQAPDLRPEGSHWTREIAIDSKGVLYLAIGARGDVLEAPSPDATVQQIGSDGTMTTFASGLRNVVGMAFYPGTDELWGTVNERDHLGGGLPPDFLAHIRRGAFYGWPYAYVGPHPDPTFGSKRPDLVSITVPPEVLFEPHSAPLGLAFYNAGQFPAEYRGDAFVAFHGSGPYNKVDGYKVVRVKFKNGEPTGEYEDFVTGFWREGPLSDRGVLSPIVLGTPAGLAVAKDGSLLVTDEKTVWRVTYGNP